MLGTIINLIRSAKIDLSNEKRSQSDLERLLTNLGIEFEREVRLTSTDIVDFMVGGIAIELKLHGSRKKHIYGQLNRYAKYDRVKTLVLASNMSMGLPSQLNGKDVYFVKLGEAWL